MPIHRPATALLLALAALTAAPAAAITTATTTAPSAAQHIAREDDAKTRTSIERTLTAMADAVIAQRVDAYLSLVWPDDEEFLNEQKYFAKDFVRVKTEAVKYTLGDFARQDDGSVVGDLTIDWNIEGKPARTITFKARFIQRDEWHRYAGEAWETHIAPGVLVMHDPGLDELAARAAEAFIAVRDHVEEGFGLADSDLSRHTQQIKLYGSMKHLQASIALAYEDPLGGWNEPGEPIKLLASSRTGPAALRNVIAHEYGHCATFVLGDKSSEMPWWVLEGVAELAANKFTGDRAERRVLSWAKRDNLAPWDQISDFHNTPREFMGHVYTQGLHMMSFISERYQREGRNAWLTALAQGAEIDTATREVFGISFEELDKDWRARIAERLAAAEAKEAEEAAKQQESADTPAKTDPEEKDAGEPAGKGG